MGRFSQDYSLRLLLLPTCFTPGDLGEAGRLKFQDKFVLLDEGTAHAFLSSFYCHFTMGLVGFSWILHAKS